MKAGLSEGWKRKRVFEFTFLHFKSGMKMSTRRAMPPEGMPRRHCYEKLLQRLVIAV